MNKKNLKKLAEDFKRKAKVAAERSYIKTRFSGYVQPEEVAKWDQKAYKYFNLAGDYYSKIGKKREAKECYEQAKKYSVFGRGVGGLEKLSASLSIISLLGALFFVSVNLTGNTILGLKAENSFLAGVCLFVFGLVFAFFYFRQKRKQSDK
ncbi:hypothetical protein DRN69_02285 [Candidatus Pacearchaeota archaeon]|nr:MAG: hypothetical protein DRN69_02285 [Candidatus Pacearchaeota archaeon]